MPATVLYICMIPGTPSYQLKLAGIRRYCTARGWNVVAVDRADSTPGNLPSLLRRPSPVGCVVEGSSNLSVARGTNTPTRYKLHDWDEAQGKWVNLRHVNGTNFVYGVSGPTATKKKVTWCKTKAFLLIVR